MRVISGFAQRAGDLVLEREAQHLLAFGFSDAGNCGEDAATQRGVMARSLKREREAFEAEESKLKERRTRLCPGEQREALDTPKVGPAKARRCPLDLLMKRIRTLGIDAAEKRRGDQS